MNKLINYLKVIGYCIAILVIYLLIISILYYFEVLNYRVTYILNYIFVLLLSGFSGFKISRYERQKGYLNGFSIGIIIAFIYFIITILMHEYNFSSLVYYLTLILSSIIGGIIGVPNKKNSLNI